MVAQQTVLIVEDEPWLAEAYADALDAATYKAVCVRTAASAIDAVDDCNPNIIVLDMFLPKVNGLQLVHELKSHTDLTAIPIILCSSIDIMITAEQLKSYGIVKILKKSELTPDKLVRSIREVLT